LRARPCAGAPSAQVPSSDGLRCGPGVRRRVRTHHSQRGAHHLLPSEHLAYAWADQPGSASYTPSTFYSSNPSGGGVSITHLGTGRYSISWAAADAQIFDGGDVQVTAYGGGNAQCKVEGWGSENATVRCFTATGVLVDSFYDVLLGS
jgi:hypothetical protein